MSRLSPLAWLQTLVWVLVLALPLQGVARASMLGCAAGEGGMSHHAIAEVAAAHHGHHPDATVHAHGDHGAPASQVETADSADLTGAAGTQLADAHHCSACAACCVGAALPSTPLRLSGPVGQGVLAAAAGPASLETVPAPLKRPPRTALA